MSDDPKPDDDRTQPLEGRCNARRTNGSGNLCRRYAGQGTEHPGIGQCSKHGGCTQSANQHAAKIREAKILGPLLAAERERIGDTPDAHAAVLEIVGERWAWRRVLERRVAELVDDHAPEGPDAIYGPDHQGDMRPHVAVTMLREATRDHLAACKVAIDAGIAERYLRLAEDEAERVAQVLHGVLTELGVIDHPEVPDVVRRHLRLIIGGKAA